MKITTSLHNRDNCKKTLNIFEKVKTETNFLKPRVHYVESLNFSNIPENGVGINVDYLIKVDKEVLEIDSYLNEDEDEIPNNVKRVFASIKEEYYEKVGENTVQFILNNPIHKQLVKLRSKIHNVNLHHAVFWYDENTKEYFMDLLGEYVILLDGSTEPMEIDLEYSYDNLEPNFF
jgi:hypothetical protein